MKKHDKLFLIVFVVISVLFNAVISQGETLVDVYRLAKEQDPKFKSAEHLYQASRQINKQSWAALLPTAALSGQQAWTSQDIVSSDNEVFGQGETDYGTQEYTFSITQPIFRYADIVRLKQGKAEMSRADREYEEAKQELLLRVSELYFEALTARDATDYVESELAAVKLHFETAKERNKARLAPITDLYDAKARLATVTASKIETENNLDDALEALKEACGVLITDFSTLTEQLPLLPPVPADVESWIMLASEENKALLIQQDNVKAAREEIRRLKAGHYPTLDLAWRYNHRDTEGTLFGGGSEVDTQELILQLHIPLYQGGKVNSKTREAAEVYQAAKKVLEQQRRSVTRQSRAAYFGIKSAISRVNALEQAVASQALTLEAKQEGFKSGLYASLAVLDAERDYYMAKKDFSQARYDYVLNTLRLKKAVGVLDEADLDKLNLWLKGSEGFSNTVGVDESSGPPETSGEGEAPEGIQTETANDN
jgi:outer membrane protein